MYALSKYVTYRLGVIDNCCPQGVFRVSLGHTHQGREQLTGADSLRDKHYHRGNDRLPVSEGSCLVKDDSLHLEGQQLHDITLYQSKTIVYYVRHCTVTCITVIQYCYSKLLGR